MRYINKIISVFILITLSFSCADYTKLDYEVEMPQTIKELEYLNNYEALKAYINREANPIFKLGSGTSLTDYTGLGVMYRILNANFDQITLGNEMKHESIVQADGSLSLGNVANLLKATREAGISVYGHTLVWHAQQRATYLNSLIDPIVIPGIPGGTKFEELITNGGFESDDLTTSFQFTSNAGVEFTAAGGGFGGTGRALKITNPEVQANDWGCQFFVKFSPAMEAGETYKFTMDVRSDVNASFSSQAHSSPTNYLHWDCVGTISSTPEWKTYTGNVVITPGAGAIAFNIGNTATSYYIDNISFSKEVTIGSIKMVEQIVNGKFATDDVSSFVFNGGNTSRSFTENGEGPGGVGRALKVTNSTQGPQAYSSQFILRFSDAQQGEKYILSMDIRADVECTAGSQSQAQAGTYNGGGVGSLNFKTGWTKFNYALTVGPGNFGNNTRFSAIAFDLGNTATNYYFANVSFAKEEMDSGDVIIEKTPEEKTEIITAELERWIKGVMEICKDDVKNWDVVNEPMSDWPDPSQLKTGVGGNLAANEFYWQDYLGKDYAVKAIQFARQYGASDIKLYINDYGLEGGNLGKCKGLIEYVKYVDSKGVKVDGIGTQMHISLDTDRDNIVEMFKLLAATGKLIKITELDMGLGGNPAITTPNATNELYLKQKDLYRFVVEKYFENIPAAQRAGITVWSSLDSPDTSGAWRRNEPIGLWNRSYSRKHAYSGFANGLAGKDASVDFK